MSISEHNRQPFERAGDEKSSGGSALLKPWDAGVGQVEQKGLKGEEKAENPVVSFERSLKEKAQPIYVEIDELPLDKMTKSVGLYSMDSMGGNVKIFLPMDETNGLRTEYEGLPAIAKEGARKKWLAINYDLESKYLKKVVLITLEQVKKDWVDRISGVTSSTELGSMGHIRGSGEQTGDTGKQKNWRIFIEDENDILEDTSKRAKPLRKALIKVGKHQGRAPGEQFQPKIDEANQEIMIAWQIKEKEFLAEGE